MPVPTIEGNVFRHVNDLLKKTLHGGIYAALINAIKECFNRAMIIGTSVRQNDTEIDLVPLRIVDMCFSDTPVRIANSFCFIPRLVISESNLSLG